MRRLWGSGTHIRSSRSPSFCKIGALCRGESVAKTYHSFSIPVNSEPEACQVFHEDWFLCPLQPPPMNVFWTWASCAFHLSTHFHLVSIFQGFVDFDFILYSFDHWRFVHILFLQRHLNGEINLHAWVCHFEPEVLSISCTEQFDILFIPLPKDIHTQCGLLEVFF